MPSQAVLFDFDGTLADTAADLGEALNRMRREQGLADLPIERLRTYASSGARGLLHAGFDLLPEDPRFAPMRDTFLAYYDERICVETRLFPGVGELLTALESRGIVWGIVTNKSTRLTRKLVDALGLRGRAACVVCGDTTAHLKPHPASLLHAAAELGIAPPSCTYLGDDLRDVQAARAARMPCVAVGWGYGSNLQDWQADAVIDHPMAMIPRLN